MTTQAKRIQPHDIPSRPPVPGGLSLDLPTLSPRADWPLLPRGLGTTPGSTSQAAETLLLVMPRGPQADALLKALTLQGLRCRQRGDGLSALMALGESAWPAAILLASELPDVSGLKVCASLRHFGFQGPLLMLLPYNQGRAKVVALDAGADDVIELSTEADEIAARLRAQSRRLLADRPEAPMRPWLSDRELVQSPRTPCDPSRRLSANPLTPREQEVLEQMVLGLGNGEIADRLVVSLDTVKTHVRNLMGKLKARHRTQAVIVALQSGYCLLPACGGMAIGPKRVGC